MALFQGLAGELVNVLREAGQIVPEALMKFGTHVKKKVYIYLIEPLLGISFLHVPNYFNSVCCNTGVQALRGSLQGNSYRCSQV